MNHFFEPKNKQKVFSWVVLLNLLLLSSCATHKQNVTSSKVEKVITTARSFIGTPYRYGGTTRTGLDCSGLLLNSFRAVDVSLPRSAVDQSKVGKEVKQSEIQPGDLVFFATSDKKKKVTHVGLVTVVKSSKEIKFIHSSSRLGVVETNLLSDYYKSRFRGARRVIY